MGTFLVFERPEFGVVRARPDDAGAPWLMAADVCRVLGWANAAQTLRSLEPGDVMVVRETGSRPRQGVPYQYSLVSENGLNELVLRSRKALARAFRDWVSGEVLPTVAGAWVPALVRPLARPATGGGAGLVRLMVRRARLAEAAKVRPRPWVVDKRAPAPCPANG
jgi:hypothetical protein